MFKEKITLKDFIDRYCIGDVYFTLATFNESKDRLKFLHDGPSVLSNYIDAVYLEWEVVEFYYHFDCILCLVIVP